MFGIGEILGAVGVLGSLFGGGGSGGGGGGGTVSQVSAGGFPTGENGQPDIANAIIKYLNYFQDFLNAAGSKDPHQYLYGVDQTWVDNSGQNAAMWNQFLHSTPGTTYQGQEGTYTLHPGGLVEASTSQTDKSKAKSQYPLVGASTPTQPPNSQQIPQYLQPAPPAQTPNLEALPSPNYIAHGAPGSFPVIGGAVHPTSTMPYLGVPQAYAPAGPGYPTMPVPMGPGYSSGGTVIPAPGTPLMPMNGPGWGINPGPVVPTGPAPYYTDPAWGYVEPGYAAAIGSNPKDITKPKKVSTLKKK